MTAGRLTGWWIILLVVITAAGGIAVWSRYPGSQPLEISISPGPEWQGKVYIDGAIGNPGLYPLKDGDSINDIIRAAGGASVSANLSQIKLHIPWAGEEHQTQRIDINLAEAWLLEALPGIGEPRARAIIDYRQKNGRFNNTNELLKVEGIGTATYENIKHLITVAD